MAERGEAVEVAAGAVVGALAAEAEHERRGHEPAGYAGAVGRSLDLALIVGAAVDGAVLGAVFLDPPAALEVIEPVVGEILIVAGPEVAFVQGEVAGLGLVFAVFVVADAAAERFAGG